MKKDNLILNFIGGFLAGLTAVDTVIDFKRSNLPPAAKLALRGAVYAGDALISYKAGQVIDAVETNLNAISDQMDEAGNGYIETTDNK